ncbi:LysR family transcriptional regulator [Litoribacillus peritrichatus]|uniref:LysR family transcriptional regulator n=1 Tax=Litoribacillus peritrichatus TaxID=718191 RepID=A0ABP7NGR1_9GAMM
MALSDDNQVFITLVNHGSFIRAANALETTSASVSRYLKKLEQRLGVQLIHRTTRSLSLTQAGQVYFESCQRIVEEKRETELKLQNLSAKPVGTLKLTSTSTFARTQLIPVIAEFSEEYPDIQFELNVSDATLDIIDAGFDLAFRAGELKDSRLRCRTVLSGFLMACASPEYIARAGLPQRPQDLASHSFIFIGHVQSVIKRFQQLLPQFHVSNSNNKVLVNDMLAAYQCACSGMGVTVLPSYLIEQDLQQGRLVPLFTSEDQLRHEVNAVFPQSAFVPNKTRVFLDYLIQRLN